jgi:cyclic pyranopterin phosphate synthase
VTYIAPQSKVFDHLDRLQAWQRGARPSPVTLEVDLTARCSLGCQSCHQAHTHTRGPWANRLRVLPNGFEGVGDVADTEVTLRWLNQAKDAGVQAIVWTGGGEPTLHPEWDTIVEHAHQLGFKQGMYTLGGHLGAAQASFLADRATWVVISLDCADGATYAAEKGVPAKRFDDACRGIKLLSTGPATIGVSFLLHAGNWGKAWDMLALSRSLGATYTTFRPTIEVSQANPGQPLGNRKWAIDAMPGLRLLSKEPDVECNPARFAEWTNWSDHGYDTCYGIRLHATITPDARMWVCVNRRGIPDSCLGDLKTESFMAAWARHPGHWNVDPQCRAMCRLHPVNQTLATVFAERQHREFI